MNRDQLLRAAERLLEESATASVTPERAHLMVQRAFGYIALARELPDAKVARPFREVAGT